MSHVTSSPPCHWWGDIWIRTWYRSATVQSLLNNILFQMIPPAQDGRTSIWDILAPLCYNRKWQFIHLYLCQWFDKSWGQLPKNLGQMQLINFRKWHYHLLYTQKSSTVFGHSLLKLYLVVLIQLSGFLTQLQLLQSVSVEPPHWAPSFFVEKVSCTKRGFIEKYFKVPTATLEEHQISMKKEGKVRGTYNIEGVPNPTTWEDTPGYMDDFQSDHDPAFSFSFSVTTLGVTLYHSNAHTAYQTLNTSNILYVNIMYQE